MKHIEQHFKAEDLDFIGVCMRNGGCNGCRYEKVCEDLLKPKEEVKNDKIPYTKEIKLPNNNRGKKK